MTPSLTEFGSIGAVLVVVWFFLKRQKEEGELNREHQTVVNGQNREVLSQVTEAYNRNTEALARTERVLDATEVALRQVLDKESK